MFVCEQHGINDPDIFAYQLSSQVRWCVDQQIAVGHSYDGRTPRPLIAWICTSADGAATSDGGDSHARASPQEDELPGDVGCFENMRHGSVGLSWGRKTVECEHKLM